MYASHTIEENITLSIYFLFERTLGSSPYFHKEFVTRTYLVVFGGRHIQVRSKGNFGIFEETHPKDRIFFLFAVERIFFLFTGITKNVIALSWTAHFAIGILIFIFSIRFFSARIAVELHNALAQFHHLCFLHTT